MVGHAAVPLTRALGAFASGWRPDDIPERAIDTITNGFLDLCACMIAGRASEPFGIVSRCESERLGADGSSSVCFSRERASAETAALLNGTAAHTLDYDDVGLIAHPSTVLVPPILAEAERLGASGKAAITAYLVGFECWAELAFRDQDSQHQKGWHPTSVLGIIGACAAVCHLNRVDEDTAVNALAIAASLASGLAANFGTMTKPFHAGHAASSAVLACRLAMAGMTAADDVLEHPSGLLSAISPKGAVDLSPVEREMGEDLALVERGLSFKKYPNCYATHRVIDALLDMAEKADLDPGDVDHVEVEVGPTQESILRNHTPKTALEAKFSMEFAVAAALVARRVTLKELSDGFVNRPDVQSLMGKVTTRISNTQCPVEPAFSFADRVVLRRKDGGEMASGDIRFARGHAKLPLDDGELHTKFVDCCEYGGYGKPQELWAALQNLSRLDDFRGIWDIDL